MWWLADIIAPALLVLGVCGFVLLVRFQTHWLTSRTTRTAEGLYAAHAELTRKQRGFAEEHKGQSPDDAAGPPRP
jgi:hypothetical protein